ncbi:hypothetical protein TH25_07525 [Thalassospira profundimaris]|uniref:Glutathione S-transferase n=1 Tax=Thalassospira profundimaris TaxID=502049 RepID=A0A367XF90_9PROT|nr:glutathione S-transferase family protein [Thalassospira profundimaris]RCK52343.1 hypothetical protein TH25_07525 [Thalassospira profundimaris]
MPHDHAGLTLHMHPLASYCWKVLIALYDADIAFEAVQLDGLPKNDSAFTDLWPLAKMPLLQHGANVVPETSIIIEYLQLHFPGKLRLIPKNPDQALEVRLWDRFFDLYVHTPMQKFVSDVLHPEQSRDPAGVSEAGETLETAYAMLEKRMETRRWMAGDVFSMADCAAFPPLFYADAIKSYRATHPALAAYFERLLQRPAIARVIDEARPWMAYFPFVDGLEPRFRPFADVPPNKE